MSEFKEGDKVLVRASVKEGLDGDGEYFLESDIGGHGFYLMAHAVEPAPEPPYVDPELVPGMVVAPLDESDKRMWHYLPSDPGDGVPFRSNYRWHRRDELPDEIRPVFDPRRVAE